MCERNYIFVNNMNQISLTQYRPMCNFGSIKKLCKTLKSLCNNKFFLAGWYWPAISTLLRARQRPRRLQGKVTSSCKSLGPSVPSLACFFFAFSFPHVISLSLFHIILSTPSIHLFHLYHLIRLRWNNFNNKPVVPQLQTLTKAQKIKER